MVPKNVLASLWFSYVLRQQLTFAYYHAKANFAIALYFSLRKSVFLSDYICLPTFQVHRFWHATKRLCYKKRKIRRNLILAILLYNRILYSTFVTFTRDSYNENFISSIFRSSFGCYQNKGGLISYLVFTLVSPSKQWTKSCSLNFSI